MDHLAPELRSKLMSRIRSKNTKPEMLIRRLLFSLGYRYRIHDTALAGSPDIVFTSRRAAIFVHGCFWHKHSGCRKAKLPSTRPEFWSEKLHRNAERDSINLKKLQELGWRVMVVWQCQLGDVQHLTADLITFLGPPKRL